MKHLAKLSKRLACIMAMALAMLGPAVAQAQISPGPLAKAHVQFEGTANCAKCHGLQREPMTRMCLSCHKEIQALRTAQRGLHGSDAAAGRKECASCHPDHAGTSFSLIAWDEGAAERFDHRRAGWALDGKHGTAKCETCHVAKFRSAPIAALSPRKSAAGWVGLDRTCASCHRADDAHDGSLANTCENCHDSRGWKPAPKFDHARSDYPLTGKHGDVACDKCHRTVQLSPRLDAKGLRPALFKPVPHRECSACHTDPHKGRLSTVCSDCHATKGFLEIDRTGFNHSLTRYPLDGKHRTVRCESCHGPQLQQKRPPFASCAACHADSHSGEATLARKSVDCADCHTTRAFAPSTFTVAQHAATKFALSGKHGAVKCGLCHTGAAMARPTAGTAPATSKTVSGAAWSGPASAEARLAPAAKLVKIRPTFAHCADCHADAHAAQLAARAGNGTCESCHTDLRWTPSTFDATAHARLKLRLEGRHAAIPCSACHGLARAGLPQHERLASAFGTAKVVFAIHETACGSCHADPHGGRYNANGAQALPNGCAACHGAQRFRPAVMDATLHARLGFAIEGAHRATPCLACHLEMRATAAPRTLVLNAKGLASLPFTAKPRTACASCHDTPHGEQFAARPVKGACERCHTVAAFAPATAFDHERDAAFSLKGAHTKVPCASCHRAPPGPGAPKSVVYRGLSGKCESCHAGRPSGVLH